MAKKIPKNRQTDADKINRGRELSRNTDNVKNQTIGLMDIDSTIFFYFDNVIKPVIEENGEQVKVPIIYANPERWAAIQKQGHIRDNKRKIMTPVISFRRTGLAKDDTIPLDKMDPTSPKLFTSYQSRFTKENRYDKLTATKGISPKREMYNVAVPDYVTLSYDFIIWTSFTDQMNSIVEKINWSEGSYWGEPGKFRFRATIDSFDDASEYDGKRSIKTTFSVTLNGYLVPDSFKDVVTTQKFITPKQIVISGETDINVLPLTDIDSDGAKSIRVVTNLGGSGGGGGGGGSNQSLTLQPGTNVDFAAFNYNGINAVTRTISLSQNPVFETLTITGSQSSSIFVNTNITASQHISASGTGSFGRLETHAIAGLSPLIVDGGLAVSGSTDFTGSLSILGNLSVDGQTTLRQVDINEKALVISGAMAVANATIGGVVQKAKAEIESLGVIGNRTLDVAPILDLGDGFQ